MYTEIEETHNKELEMQSIHERLEEIRSYLQKEIAFKQNIIEGQGAQITQLKSLSDDKALKITRLEDQLQECRQTNEGTRQLINKLLNDISNYQKARLVKDDHGKAKASPKTVNLEVATIRAVLRRHKLWAAIGDDVRMLPVRNDTGRALTLAEEDALFESCAKSRSRVLYPFVVLALNTGMRYSDIRLLQWEQVDLVGRVITVGASKTEAGTGRKVPLNERAFKAMVAWAQLFPDRKPDHYVFPSEQYGIATNARTVCVSSTDPTTPTTSVQEAWQLAKGRCNVRCRLHDLRHTACTRMLEAGVPLTVIASILGWSGSTMVLMAKRYGHIGAQAKQDAVAMLDRPQKREEPAVSTTESPVESRDTGRTIN